MGLWDAKAEGYGTPGYGEPVKDKAESFEASEWAPVKLEIGGTYYGNVPAQVSYNEINLDLSNKVQAPEKPIWEFTINPIKSAWDSLDVGKYVPALAVLTVVNSDLLSASLMDKFKYKNASEAGSSRAAEEIGVAAKEPSEAVVQIERTVTQDVSKVPNASNYRESFLKESPEMPRNYQVHHTLPQKYQEILNDTGINIHETQYLEGIDPAVHSKITSEWASWEKSLGRTPTAEEVIDFAKQIDSKYGAYWYNR